MCVFCFPPSTDGDDHGVCRGDTAHAIAQWQHLVASLIATPYPPGGMVVAIAVKFGAFSSIKNRLVLDNYLLLRYFIELNKSLW